MISLHFIDKPGNIGMLVSIGNFFEKNDYFWQFKKTNNNYFWQFLLKNNNYFWQF